MAGGRDMEITQVRVFPVEEDKLKAFVSIVIDDCFVVSDIKIIEGGNGLFVSMPSKRRKNGTFRDIAHPLNNDTRRRIEFQIIEEYREVISVDGGEDSAALRTLGDQLDQAVQPVGVSSEREANEEIEERPGAWP
jgi:stage V sporulation protein G